ncbi:MAG: protein kinase domain-containing protein [Acidobacteriota bacterium]
MTLSAGTRLGPYEVGKLLGAGGMGEVYRATDTKLRRDVALKVLPGEFSRDDERMARLEREAQLLASLNHPHIAAIYGLEESNGVRALAMELVDGPTLGERIAAGPIPVDEALPIARQIAEALEYAHDKGIIHRDLKPANVKITHDGNVKVLDFGLAKALEGDPAAVDAAKSPTITFAATQAGVIMGTAAYMSPEQARGKPADRRSDIWAFGCVLYEMLTGRPAFEGETVSDTLAAVLRADIDWRSLPAAAPPSIRQLLRRCLDRDPKRRLQSVAEARIAVQVTEENPITAANESPAARAGWKQILPWAATAVMAVLAASLLFWPPSRGADAQPSFRLVVALPPNENLRATVKLATAISPDGSRLAYVATRGGQVQLFIRPLDQFEAAPIEGTEGASNPFFSPDGQWVGYFAQGKLKKIPISGGAPVEICRGTEDERGASWGTDNVIIFTPTTRPDKGLFKVSAAGGAPEMITTPDRGKDEGNHRWPEVLPGGKWVLFTIESPGRSSFDEARIGLLSLETGERRVLIEGGSNARYSSTGHILYGRTGRIFGAPFDLDRLQVTGPSVPILEGVRTLPTTGAAHFSLSRSGSLVYVPDTAGGGIQSLRWVDRQGSSTPIAAPRRSYISTSLSPDGGQLALTIGAADSDIWLYDLRRGILTRLTFEIGDDFMPCWTPDGKRVTYSSEKNGPANLFWRPIDGSAPEERLLESRYDQYPGSWSRDGRLLAYEEEHPDTQKDIWVLPRDGDRKPRPFLRTPFDEEAPRFSPDGRWIAYTSTESGHGEVYVQAFPGPGGKRQITTGGGQGPVWGPNGKELFYLNPENRLMVVSVETHLSFTISVPRQISPMPTALGTRYGRVYDITPDGRRFVVVKEDEESGSTHLNVVLNWFEELRRVAK